MDERIFERLSKVGKETKIAEDSLNVNIGRILDLETLEYNSLGNASYWLDGGPTINLPEVLILGTEVQVVYQNPRYDIFDYRLGIDIGRGALDVKIMKSKILGVTNFISIDNIGVTPTLDLVTDVSDLLGAYHDKLVQVSGNNFVQVQSASPKVA